MEIIKIIDKPIQQRTFLYEFQIENEDTDYFIQKIENNIDSELSGRTNVKGLMTSYKLFVNDDLLRKTLHSVIENVDAIKNYGTGRMRLIDAWGIKLLVGQHTQPHTHRGCYLSGIWYLNDCDNPLIFPELNLNIKPKKNRILFWDPVLRHYTPVVEDKTKYALVFNFEEAKAWDNLKGAQE